MARMSMADSARSLQLLNCKAWPDSGDRQDWGLCLPDDNPHDTSCQWQHQLREPCSLLVNQSSPLAVSTQQCWAITKLLSSFCSVQKTGRPTNLLCAVCFQFWILWMACQSLWEVIFLEIASVSWCMLLQFRRKSIIITWSVASDDGGKFMLSSTDFNCLRIY